MPRLKPLQIHFGREEELIFRGRIHVQKRSNRIPEHIRLKEKSTTVNIKDYT